MCQAVLSPNLTKKFQWEVSQIVDNRFPVVMLLGGLSVNLNHLKIKVSINSWMSNSNVHISFYSEVFKINVITAGLKVVGEVKKVGKSRNFQPKVGKSRNFSAFKVGKSRNFISVFIIVLSNMLVSFVVFEANHLFF